MTDILDVFRAAETMGVRESDVQRAYAARIGEIIACAETHGHGQGLVEAETGTGKTLGYLIPSILHAASTGKRVVIATYTRQLQSQILSSGGDMDRALSAVEQVTGVRLTAARLLGRRNFIDTERLNNFYREAQADKSLSPEEMDEWDAFAFWAENSETGEISEFFEEEGGDSLPGGLDVEDVCLTPLSSDAAKKRYVSHVEAAKAADILVTNHALLVRAALSGIRLLHHVEDERGVGVLLVDECDRLPDVARDATSDLLPLREMEAALRRWNEKQESNVSKPLLAAVAQLAETMSSHCPHGGLLGKESFTLFDDLEPSARLSISAELERFLTAAKPFKKTLGRAGKDDLDVATSLAEYIRVAQDVADTIQQRKDTDVLVAVRWSPKRQYPSFRLFRLYPGRILKRLWAPWQGGEDSEAGKEDGREPPVRAGALILTSATLSAPSKSGQPNFMETKMELGIFDPENACAHLHAGFSPSSFGQASFVVPDPSAPHPFTTFYGDDEEERELNPAWLDYAALMVATARKEGGRVLVLTNSYTATAYIAERLRTKKLSPIEKTRQRRAQDCVKEFVADPEAIFISPSAWEGLDLKGYGVTNGIKHVVITQLPYSALDGARSLAFQRQLRKKGLSVQDARRVGYTNIRAVALRRFKQGFGRGIRDRKDSMTLWVADPRFPAPRFFDNDMTGQIPPRTVKPHPEFVWAIPKRFRSGALGNPFDDDARMFLMDGRLVGSEELEEA